MIDVHKDPEILLIRIGWGILIYFCQMQEKVHIAKIIINLRKKKRKEKKRYS